MKVELKKEPDFGVTKERNKKFMLAAGEAFLHFQKQNREYSEAEVFNKIFEIVEPEDNNEFAFVVIQVSSIVGDAETQISLINMYLQSIKVN